MPRRDLDAGALRRIFCRIVEKIEQHLLHQHHVEIEHWQIAFEIDFDRVVLQDLIGPLHGRADDVGEIGRSGVRLERPGFEPRHVEKIADKAVEPLGLLQNGAQEACLNGCIELLSMGYKAARGAENRSKRGAQIMRNRGQQGRAQAIGLRRQTGAVNFLGEIDAIDRQSRLIRQGVQKPGLFRCQKQSRLVAIDPGNAHGATPGAQGHEAAFGAGQRIGAAPSRLIFFKAPARRSEIRLVEHVFGRKPGLDTKTAVLGQKHDDTNLQHQGDLMHRRPEQVVECCDAGELAAEKIEFLGDPRALSRRDRLGADPRGEIARDQRHDREKEQDDDVLGIGDGECVERRKEKKIIGKNADETGK